VHSPIGLLPTSNVSTGMWLQSILAEPVYLVASLEKCIKCARPCCIFQMDFAEFFYYSIPMWFVHSVLWRCWLGGRKGIRPVKTEWWGAGVVICMQRGADLHMAQLMPLPLTVSCFSKIQIGFTFLVPAHLGSPGKRAVKRVYVLFRCEVKMSLIAKNFTSFHLLEVYSYSI